MQFKTKPFTHQQKFWEESKEIKDYAVFWEQGTGKTKFIIDCFSWLYQENKIDCVVIVAPNGVHRNWIDDELPVHLPDEIAKDTYNFIYVSAKAKTKYSKAWQQRAIHHSGLSIIAMNYDAILTENGRKFLWNLFKKRKVFYVLDEATRIKTPGAKRTKRIVASGKYAAYKRILTGTPVANSPFDVYSMIRFLNEEFWKKHQLDSFYAFKHYFGVWEKQYNKKTETEYEQLIHFKRLEELNQILNEVGSRVLKDDVLDLPPKLYAKRYFEMSTEQRRIYEDLKNEFKTFLSSGELITAPLAITRMLRLRQVCSGYIATDSDNPMHVIPGKNPRLELLKEICEDTPHKTIIWAKYRMDVDLIMKELGDKAVRYDGAVSDEERVESKNAFQKGDKQFIVINLYYNEGLTFTAAKTVIYYNNDFSYLTRIQSEDRAHRSGQTSNVEYIDLIAEDSIDLHIVKSLRQKYNIAAKVTGDEIKTWL